MLLVAWVVVVLLVLSVLALVSELVVVVVVEVVLLQPCLLMPIYYQVFISIVRRYVVCIVTCNSSPNEFADTVLSTVALLSAVRASVGFLPFS